MNAFWWFHNTSFTTKLIVVCILLLLSAAGITRFYKLGDVPHGMTWDEVAIGYNGYSVVTTRRDEWLQRLPVSFQSYGDYKAPFAIYLVGISTFILGLTSFAVRVPFAVSGIVFIVSFTWLVWLLTESTQYRRALTILGLLFAVTSPWHLHYSRIGFESGIALACITTAVAIFFYVRPYFSIIKYSPVKIIGTAGVALLLISAVYAYHSAKIVVPLLLLYLAITVRDSIKKQVLLIGSVTLLSAALLYPLINDSLTGSGAERANVLLTSQGLSASETALSVSKNMLLHFDPSFLVLGKVDTYRHGIGTLGVLSIPTFVFVVVGSIAFVLKKNQSLPTLTFLALFLILVGIFPAALSAETVPHSNRALLALPGFLLLALSGVNVSLTLVDSKLLVRLIIGGTILIELLLFLYLWHYYLTIFATRSAPDFQDGYIEAMTIAKQYEKGEAGYPEVSTILVSSEYGQPYMYALFVRKTSPIFYRGGSLNKYQFTDSIQLSDMERENTLLVATPSNNLPIDQADYIVKGSDGSNRFLLYYTDN